MSILLKIVWNSFDYIFIRGIRFSKFKNIKKNKKNYPKIQVFKVRCSALDICMCFTC